MIVSLIVQQIYRVRLLKIFRNQEFFPKTVFAKNSNVIKLRGKLPLSEVKLEC